jgi:hypothetical protein
LRVRLPRPKGAVVIALSPEPEKIDDFENPAANLLGGARTVLAIGQPAAIEDITAIAIPGSSLVLHTQHQTHVLHVDLSAGVPGSTRRRARLRACLKSPGQQSPTATDRFLN